MSRQSSVRSPNRAYKQAALLAMRKGFNPLDYVDGKALSKQLKSNPGDKNYGKTMPSGAKKLVIPGGKKKVSGKAAKNAVAGYSKGRGRPD